MPVHLLSAFITEMPSIQAEETVGRMQAVALGSGTLKKEDGESLMRHIRGLIGHGATPVPADEVSRQFGFPVKRVKKD